jgi:aminomethyltransferase
MGETPLKHTPLYDLHVDLGAKMVPFAGYAMPVQYSGGIISEHLHTREKAGLFDVSHMGQVRITGEAAAAAFERLVPGDIQGLDVGRMRYTQFTNDDGGILDDLMITRRADGLFVVVNAACKDQDVGLIRAALSGNCDIDYMEGRGLLALQGPMAVDVLAVRATGARDLTFMTVADMEIGGISCFVTRSGYTGEDGFEISVAAEQAADLAHILLDDDRVEPIGLGARDTLRLEAGLCLYGSDIDTTTTPVEAGLLWSIGKRRREEGGFPGDAVIRKQIAEGVARRRVGIRPEGRAPARAHTVINDTNGEQVGEITSGGFSPSLQAPIAMGYVRTDLAKAGTKVSLDVRGRALPAEVVAMPFVKKRYSGK